MLSNEEGYWLGVIIGYANGRCAKGVMQFIEEDDTFLSLRRMDGRVFLVNKREVSAIMYDVLVQASYVEGHPEDEADIKQWYIDNIRKDND